jgi:hypothetical protein
VWVRFPPPAPSKLAGSDKPTVQGQEPAVADRLGDPSPGLSFLEMTIGGYCHFGPRNPGRDLTRLC